MQQALKLPEPNWLDLWAALARALEFFAGSDQAEVERMLVTAFFEGVIPTRGRLSQFARLKLLDVTLWDPKCTLAISWRGNCFAAQHRSRWRNDIQEYRITDVQG